MRYAEAAGFALTVNKAESTSVSKTKNVEARCAKAVEKAEQTRPEKNYQGSRVCHYGQ